MIGSALFIRRPIATSLLALAILIGGWLGYSLLPISALPQVDFPTIEITTQLPGANPDTVASLITAPLERQLGQIASLTTMTSTSTFGLSEITLQFDLSRDIDSAAQDVQSAINAAGSSLPRGLPYPPVYSKVNPADAPILTVALTSTTVPVRQLSDIADTILTQRLSQVTGVGRVVIEGGVRPAVRIDADLGRLASYGLGLEDLRAAIVGANVAGPKGYIDGPQQSFTISANDQINAAADYNNVTIAYKNGAPVRIADVASVKNGLENAQVSAQYRGQPAVIIGIQRQPGANVVQTVALVRADLQRLVASLPKGVTLNYVQDRTSTIKASISDVQFTLILSVLLVVLVVFIFLRTLRATLIAAVALPLSLIATFGVMYFAKFSLDNLSLMALTIGTGFVVDDAIVMIENIARHIEDGEAPFEAALQGAAEIGFTVISLTVSLIAVFIPLLFMTGIVGRMFREFAVTLTIAVVVSAIVSLTLTPMMCAWVLKARKNRQEAAAGRLERLTESGLAAYRRSLEWVLGHETLMLVAILLTLAGTFALYAGIDKGFLPSQDTGLISAVGEADPTVSFAQLQKRQYAVAAKLREDKDVASVTAIVGVSNVNATANAGALTIVLKPRQQRTRTADQVIPHLVALAHEVPGIVMTFQSVQDVQISTRSSRARYQYTLLGVDQGEVDSWTDKLVAALKNSSVLDDVAAEAQNGGARLQVNVDRAAAGRLGVSMQNVSDALDDAFGQRQVSTIYAQTNQYRVILEAGPQWRANSQSLKQIYVPGVAGAQVPLSAFTTITTTSAPLAIEHEEQFPADTISFNLKPGGSLGAAEQEIASASAAIGMPATISGSYSGDASEFQSSLAGEPLLILAAVVAIYIVLGVLYESAIHPVTILSTLPSAGVGALIALILTGHELSLIALIGIVLLMGIVKKNAIMMIDFALEAERVEGLSPRDAILKAAQLRFRPIMMTTLAALFGALPLALGHGEGSELRIPLGITIIGGLLASQLITLYSTPVIYLMMERVRVRLGGKKLEPIDESPVVVADVGPRKAAE
ncbi:MAG: efflux RND transporter permease subunit [Hyphomicrobiales bacterium]|nr:efflux RND transporter permease subunit [Hyphomicrobiales bacterium]